MAENGKGWPRGRLQWIFGTWRGRTPDMNDEDDNGARL